MQITANKKRAARVLGTLLESYRQRRYPFNLPWVTPPQVPQNMPQNLVLGTREHALFLFITCYWMKGGVESDTAFRNLSKVYDKRPDLFLPELVDKEFGEEEVFEAIRKAGLGLFGNAEFWVRNHRILRDWWQSDPVRCFAGVRSYEDALRNIRNNKKSGEHHRGFFGFQEKMVSMITYFYMDAGFVSPFNFPIPVDVHVSRTMIAHELVTVSFTEKEAAKGYYVKPILDEMRRVLLEFCREHQADPLELCNAIWLLGKHMCGETPGNDSIGSGGKRGRKVEIKPVELVWNEAQARAYEETCGLCPVESTCRYYIPSGPYYRKGVLAIRSERVVPDHSNRFLILPEQGFLPVYEVGAYKRRESAAESPPPPDTEQMTLEL